MLGTSARMSTAILPDDSVVVRMPTHTVHVDASSRAIHVREPSKTSQLGGIIRASFPLEAADRIRLMTARTGKQHLCLDLSSGETLDLGEVPSADVAMVTARAIADLTRCKIEVAGTSGLAAPSARFTEGETYASPQGFVPWRGEELPVPDEGSSLAISPDHADRMYQVIEALMESQDELKAPPVPEDPPLVPGDTRTVEMTWEEAERAMARARARAKPAADGAAPVTPSDLEEDESDHPTVTPPAPVRGLSKKVEADGLASTDRDRPIEEIQEIEEVGVDGLAQTIADRSISDLALFRNSETTSADAPAASDPAMDASGDSTQPDRPLPEELRNDAVAGTQPDPPVDDAFDENTELDEAAHEVAREPIFQQLLLESQMAAAMSPAAGVGVSAGESHAAPGQTDLHVVAAPRQSGLEAIVEMLRLTVEALPEASLSLADEED